MKKYPSTLFTRPKNKNDNCLRPESIFVNNNSSRKVFMEGFLTKRGRGESKSIFSRKNWKRRWFILEGYFMVYYENFDNIKGFLLVFHSIYLEF